MYVSRLIKTVNKKGKLKCSLVFDEFPTIYLNNMDSLIATARSNKGSTTLGVQDLSQLKKDYGKDQADVIMNITGNIISGQVTGEFVGMVADDPDNKIDLKTFHCSIQNNHAALKKEKYSYKPIPIVCQFSRATIQQNYLQIKLDIEGLVETEMGRMLNNPQ